MTFFDGRTVDAEPAPGDPWGDPLGGLANAPLDRAVRREQFARELGVALAAIGTATNAFRYLDRRKLRVGFAMWADNLERELAALSEAVADATAVMRGHRPQ